ncbi:MAG: hypothetical protein DRG83_16425 [Deltaproteobacteria bacterium]|nr:MAG: hypothetical protein DRG83_16425 [Deltaproteobacteria bacterium]
MKLKSQFQRGNLCFFWCFFLLIFFLPSVFAIEVKNPSIRSAGVMGKSSSETFKRNRINKKIIATLNEWKDKYLFTDKGAFKIHDNTKVIDFVKTSKKNKKSLKQKVELIFVNDKLYLIIIRPE